MYGHEVTHARGEYDAVALGRDIGSGWRQSAQMLGDRQGTALIKDPSVACARIAITISGLAVLAANPWASRRRSLSGSLSKKVAMRSLRVRPSVGLYSSCTEVIRT